MKKFKSSMLGVTLLEIMLVLAIAAMIIVMSIRYYQSAGTSNQANAVLQQIQAITAMADNLAQTNGSYSQISSGTLKPLLPGNSFTAPWGGAITISNPTTISYDVSIASTPGAVCTLILNRLKNNAQYTGVTCPPSGGNLTYTYKPSP